MKKFVLPLAFLTLLSCEKTINFDLPTEEPQLAVTSKIVANDSIHAIVSISAPALSPKTSYSQDAVITLLENGAIVDTLTVLNEQIIFDNVPVYLFTSSYDCTPSNTYTLKASQASYNSVEGSVIVPGLPVLTNTTYDSQTLMVETTIMDPEGLGDVYRIEIVDEDEDFGRGFYSKDLSLEFYEYYDDFLDIDGEGKFGTRAYVRDEFFDGGSKKIELKYEEYFGTQEPLFLKITALSTSQYEFEKSLDIASFGGDGPFSEPLTVYSNMSNLKGNFGAEHSVQVQFFP